MKFPVKFNRAFWPGFLTRLLPSADDPRTLAIGQVDEVAFSKMVSTFKFGATFKSTRPRRFPLTLAQLASLPYPSPPVILDVAASGGITSLDVMSVMPYKKYYVTDLNLEVLFLESGKTTYFYERTGGCILAVDDSWIVYADYANALFPFNRIAASMIKRAPPFEDNYSKISLVSPTLLSADRERVVITRHNIFEKWPFEKADLILAANILNRVYFPEERILAAMENLLEALSGVGRLAVVDNRDVERASIFQLIDGKVAVERRINGGTEIETMVLDRFGGGSPA